MILTDDERIARGHRAANELKITDEAFAGIEADLYRRLKETSALDVDNVRHFHRCIQLLGQVQHALKLAVVDGNNAAAIAAAGLARN